MENNAYLLLLLKELQGHISPEEAAQLRQWRASSPENDATARDYTLLWEKAEGFNKQFNPDLDAAFAKVQAGIQRPEETPMQSRTFFRKYLRAAAAIALLAISVWGYQQYVNAPAALNELATAGQQEVRQIALSDGTEVWLRNGSSLQFPSKFSGKKRVVKLNGEGYFKVAHDAKHPFQVRLDNHGYVQVLGTEFGVNQHTGNTTVLVRNGRVQFSPNGKTKSPVLTASQKATYDADKSRLSISNVNSLNDLAWQAGGLEFVKTPLSQVIEDIEKYYHVKIALQNRQVANCLHSSPLTRDSVDHVLQGIALAYGFKLRHTGAGSYELSGGACPD